MKINEIENPKSNIVNTNSSALGIRDVEPWHEPVNGAELLDELAATVRRFVVLPNWGTEAMALWILHTYAFELRDVSAYVGIESPEKRCGKTTLLGLLSELVNRPIVAANISSPAFFRVIEETRPTLLIDEADTFLQGNDELRGILNSGYAKTTAFVVRVANETKQPTGTSGAHTDGNGASGADVNRKSDGTRLARFSSWCPKAVAAIGRLPETLADRCILVRMQRKTVAEKCERLKNLGGEILRRKCARFIQDHADQIQSAQPSIPEALNDRAADIWEPLFALADLAGSLQSDDINSKSAICNSKQSWGKIARDAALGLTAAQQQSHPIGSFLVDVMLAFMAAQTEKLFSRDMVTRLIIRELRPWTEMLRGRQLTELKVAQILRGYGIRPRTLWIDGQTAKGYVRSDFEPLFKRYVPQSEMDALREEVMPESERAAYERRQQEAELRALSARTGNLMDMARMLGRR